MNYLDKILDRYNHSVDDEYEREILHQSSSIALHLLAYSMIVVGAILAWVIPGPASLWSMLVFWPVIVCSVIASAWMKKRAPRPRSITFLGSEIAFMVVVMAVWLGGVWVNAFEAHLASGFGLIGGGVVGAIVGGVATGVALKKARAKDEQRFEEENDAEDLEFDRP